MKRILKNTQKSKRIEKIDRIVYSILFVAYFKEKRSKNIDLFRPSIEFWKVSKNVDKVLFCIIFGCPNNVSQQKDQGIVESK